MCSEKVQRVLNVLNFYTQNIEDEIPTKAAITFQIKLYHSRRKKLVQQLQVRLTPRSTLRMVRQLGREPGQVKAWQKTHSPDSFQRTSKYYVAKSFYELYMEVFNKGKAYKNKYRVCVPFCEKNDTLVLCPSCNLWF